jgi:hypothetical protein
MNQRIEASTPDEKIVHLAKEWRPLDKAVIADKDNQNKRRAEFQARQKLRHAIDLAGGQP